MYGTSATLGTAILLALPVAAAAYGTPEEILFQSSGYSTLKPPIQRETGDRADEQMLRSQQRREAEQAAIFEAQRQAREREQAASAPQPAAEPAEEEKPVLEDILSSLQQSIEKLNERGGHAAAPAEENAEGMTIAPWEDSMSNEEENGGSLHSGAPLAPTGAGSWLAAGAIMAAIGWTLRRIKPAAVQKEIA